MRITFVAAPLTARSGVYRSARETVEEGRRQGQEWSLVLGVSSRAGGGVPADDPSWIHEFEIEPSGIGGVRSLSRRLRSITAVADSDLVVSLIPQTDMALAGAGITWVSYLRGVPWPQRDEAGLSKRLAWMTLELLALSRAQAIWATTAILQRSVTPFVRAQIVRPGIEPISRTSNGSERLGTVVWAARFDRDKNPELFVDAMRGLPIPGIMYGSGPLRDSIAASVPENVAIGDWVDPRSLWSDALVYVGTSRREAFGRSAVEAAMNGTPVVVSDAFGAAPFLYTDAELRRQFVLPVAETTRWRSAIESLATDPELRQRVSAHVAQNASGLTIGRSVEEISIAADAALRKGGR